jgi:hypothetical protein
VLLYWVIRRKFPRDELLKLSLGRAFEVAEMCWVLGDRYDIPEFQDDAMMVILQILNADKALLPYGIKHTFSHTRPGSKLRILATEEPVLNIYTKRMAFDQLDDYFNSMNFVGEFMELYERLRDPTGKEWARVAKRLQKPGTDDCEHWKSFMVADGATRLAEIAQTANPLALR